MVKVSMKTAIERIGNIANLTEMKRMKAELENSSSENWYAGKLAAFNTAIAILTEEGA